MRKHALLSASSAERWLHCPPSARLGEEVKIDEAESPSIYAREGTVAHALAEALLLDDKEAVAALKEDDLYYPAMLEEVGEYVDFCKEEFLALKQKDKNALCEIEKRLDFSTYVPKGFGTGDCILIGDKEIHVIDLKFGKGVEVYPRENPQLMLYGLGALYAYGFLWELETVKLTIAQVRLGNVSTWEIPTKDLIRWGNTEVKPIAEKAYNGEGEVSPGDWCRWCPYRVLCKERAEQFLSVFEKHTEPEALTAKEIGEILDIGKNISAWLSDLEAFALKEITGGAEIPGYKVVEGRSTRKITDEEAFAKVLLGELPEDKVYKPKALQTITFLEKQLGKKKFAELGNAFIVKPQGSPTLAKVDDKRPAMFGAESDFNFQ